MPEEDATVFEHIGDTYQKLGKPRRRLDYWQKAQGLDTENKGLAEKISASETAGRAGRGYRHGQGEVVPSSRRRIPARRASIRRANSQRSAAP